MHYFSEKQLQRLRRELGTVPAKYNELLLGYGGLAYRTPRAGEFALQGFIRRTGTLKHCTETLFGTLPPDFKGLPSADRLNDAEVILQSFVFNLFGCMDNLAWLWVEQHGIVNSGGSRLSRFEVGLGPKCKLVRRSLTKDIQKLLSARQKWFAYLELVRHALAHRIPLYIPSFSITPANHGEYQKLEEQIAEAIIQAKPGRERWLRAKQRKLMFFRPLVAGSWGENADIFVLHPQMLADYNTVHELGLAFLKALRTRTTS